MRQLFFAVKDKKGWDAISFDEAWEKNQHGAELYFTVNEFQGNRRVKEELKAILHVAADFDGITESELLSRLKRFPNPTMIVRTGNGFHVWWWLKTPVVVDDPLKWSERYREFVESTLVPIGADPNAKDVCRVLRYPASKYWKGKEQTCDLILDTETGYTWEQLQKLFPRPAKAPPLQNYSSGVPRVRPPLKNDSEPFKDAFWEKANSIPQIDGLRHLSGSAHVGGEVYTFKKQGDVVRILVNGKPSNAWLDKDGRIGSTQNAGPFITNWLRYFGHDWKTVADIMKKEFEL
jgi:hypothetical protein